MTWLIKSNILAVWKLWLALQNSYTKWSTKIWALLPDNRESRTGSLCFIKHCRRMCLIWYGLPFYKILTERGFYAEQHWTSSGRENDQEPLAFLFKLKLTKALIDFLYVFKMLYWLYEYCIGGCYQCIFRPDKVTRTLARYSQDDRSRNDTIFETNF